MRAKQHRLTDEQRAMCERNLGLAYAAAGRLSRRYRRLSFDTVLSCCLEGLCIACAKYDPEKGSISTYAKFWCEQVVGRAARNDRVIHIPEYLLKHTTVKPPEYMAAAERVKSLVSLGHRTEENEPVDVPYFDPEPDDRLDLIPDAIDQLPERLQRVITLRFLSHKNYSLAEIGAAEGVTKERARQLVDLALQQLREAIPA